jgi:hypothetical protein
MQKKGAGCIDFWCNTVCWLDAIAAGALIALFLRGNAPERSVRSRLLLGIGALVLWVLTRRFRDSLIYPDIISYPLVIIGTGRGTGAALGEVITPNSPRSSLHALMVQSMIHRYTPGIANALLAPLSYR